MGAALFKCLGWWRDSVREELEEFNVEAAETHESSSSTSSTNYDVFLSFSGKDTRATFTGHLYHGLDQAGIQTFMDEAELKKGDVIGPSLLNAIAESRISIPIFSLNYASSKWCLDELVEIMKSRDTKGQTVLPIFFHVNPRDVRKQTEGFGQQFHKLAKKSNTEKVESWKKALKEAGELKGWDIKNIDNGNEATLIQIVVKTIWCELRETSFNVPENLVGINYRVTELLDILNLKSKDVKIVGIWGMGGIGKTTIAQVIFNQIRHMFEGSILLEDIRDQASKQPKGLVSLQKELLSTILKHEFQTISNVNDGKSLIKNCLHAKEVLIVLDDVDNIEQLEALAGMPNWFGRGSRIILTTRDEHLLNIHKVHEIYEVKELDCDHSLNLFSKHAFGKDLPPHDFVKLAKDVVHTAGGLPLAIKVLGSFLSDKRSPSLWRSTLDRLEKIPHKDIRGKLKISYDGLDDPDKEIFCDIACFFIGTNKEYTTDIWEGCGFSPELGIRNLLQRSLIKIDCCNELRMHDQLRDMGRHIVHQESPDDPGNRSRLWSREEVLNVLKEMEGTRKVKGLILKFEEDETMSKEIQFRTKSFATMSKLRLLQIDNAKLVGGFKKLPSELRWFSWKGCPLEYIPTDFRLEKLAVLDLSYSRIKQVWYDLDQNKEFPELKVLILSNCRDLTESPDFSRFPNLERLNLEGCIKLEELQSSICKLEALKNLNLSGCSNLNNVSELLGSLTQLEVIKLVDCKFLGRSPDWIGNKRNLKALTLDGTSITALPDAVGLLENIETLSVKHCPNLVKLPDSMGKMSLLSRFFIDDTGVVKLPEDFGMLTSLTRLTMADCPDFRSFPQNFGNLVRLETLCVSGNSKLAVLPDSFCCLSSLEELKASNCNFSEDGIPSDFGKLTSLVTLDLSCNNFRSLPTSFSGLCQLRNLYLKYCRNLQYLPNMPSSLGSLEIQDCVSLERLSDLSDLKQLRQLFLSNCNKLSEVQGVEEMVSFRELSTSGCSTALVNGVCVRFGQRMPKYWVISGSEIPDWFAPMEPFDPSSFVARRFGSESIRYKAALKQQWNPQQHRKIIGLVLCLVFPSQPENTESFFEVLIREELVLSRGIPPNSRQDQICLCHLRLDHIYDCVPDLEQGDEVWLLIKSDREIEVTSGGMLLCYEDTALSTLRRTVDFIIRSSRRNDGYDNKEVENQDSFFASSSSLQDGVEEENQQKWWDPPPPSPLSMPSEVRKIDLIFG